MPATYTYNDAIDDAICVLVRHWEAKNQPEDDVKELLKIIGKMADLRRPTRRKKPHPPRPRRGHE